MLVLASRSAGTPPAGGSVGASVVNGAITVDAKPFFPVMLLDQCDTGAAARAASLGVNVLLNAGCGSVAAAKQLGELRNGQLGVLPIGGSKARHPKLLGWTYPDEPDNNGWSAAGLASAYGYPRGNPDGLLSFVTTTGRFFGGPDPAAASAATRALAGIADVAGFDLYPLNHCSSTLRSVYDAQRRFTRLARRPTFQWIETGPIEDDYCGGFQMTPEQLTAEAWLAVAGGARAIGFFTHTASPTVSDFALAPPLQNAIRRFARIAAAITPGLTGTTVAATSDTSAILALARLGGGHTYVVAVNTLESVVPAQLTVPRVRGHTLRVVGESRTVATHGDRFADTFPPLGVHVYVTS